MRKYESFDPSNLTEDVDLRKMPEGMLVTLSKMVHNKKRAGGKPTETDRKMVTRAKAEIRRRRLLAMRGAVREDTAVSDAIASLLEKYAVASVSELSEEQTAELVAVVNTINTPGV
jgi:hypothetical protein